MKIITKNEIKINDNLEVLKHLPSNLSKIVQKIDDIVQTPTDTIVVAALSALASLFDGAKVGIEKDSIGRPIIIYSAAFMPSGTGKSAAASVLQKYLLKWQEKEEKKKDIFLNTASAEGLESSFVAGSSPLIYLDEFGILIKLAKTDIVRKSFLTMLTTIFDSGAFITKRLKNSKKGKYIEIKGAGLFVTSTLGRANLSNIELKDYIENGALNRFLITFFQKPKPIPFKGELNEYEASETENFAKLFKKEASNKKFYFSYPAIAEYKEFHDSINHKYIENLERQEDGAGLEIRQLTFLQRIAAIFQVCLNIQSNLNTQKEIEINIEALQLAKAFLQYMDINHFQQIELYVSSKTGKVTIEQRIINLLRKSPKNFRELQTSLARYSNTKNLKIALENLIRKRIIAKNNDHYFKR